MKRRFGPSPLPLTAALLALSGLFVGCSKSDKATNPAPVTEPFESGNLGNSAPTNTFVHVFNTAGSFSYRCRIHSTMTGAVSVAVGGSDSSIVGITNFAFGAPSAPSIKPGGYVRWINSGSTHTVTRP